MFIPRKQELDLKGPFNKSLKAKYIFYLKGTDSILIYLKNKGFIHLLPRHEELQLAEVILLSSTRLSSNKCLTKLNSRSCLSSTLST